MCKRAELDKVTKIIKYVRPEWTAVATRVAVRSLNRLDCRATGRNVRPSPPNLVGCGDLAKANGSRRLGGGTSGDRKERTTVDVRVVRAFVLLFMPELRFPSFFRPDFDYWCKVTPKRHIFAKNETKLHNTWNLNKSHKPRQNPY